MRAGSRLNSSEPKPSQPQKKPLIARVSATGIPSASRTKKEAMEDRAGISFSGMFERLVWLGGGRNHATEKRNQRPQGGGQALHQQQQEAERDHRFENEAIRQPAGIGRFLADQVGLHHIADAELDDDGG